ncbi:Transposase DDE domain protein [Gimesia maris]|uniref:IS4 family transposase n=1 Tax=Gimesia maris TaxID=122 RepID=UPI001187F9DC|nr:IS4 family transposase [Gimesia maris]QDT78601.1 Transposase DDE domain protein [Gimesia maris]
MAVNLSESSSEDSSSFQLILDSFLSSTGLPFSNLLSAELEEVAEEPWLWKGRHAKLIDGFTFTMPDTEQIQLEFPQANTQAPGCGLPIARTVAILSLATACIADAAIGPYKGKQASETALLRTLFGSLNPDDVVVCDRYHCSFMLIAALTKRGTDVCARLHQKRKPDFRRGKRLGKYDHLIIWTRPQRPKWMDRAAFEQIPEAILLREIRYNLVENGRRTQTMTVVTTLLDEQHTKQDIAKLYGLRWNVELDLRHIKDTLNLGHLRCKSPAMIRCELWTTMLGYNLIRATAAGAALLHQKRPRLISFTSACQFILSAWMNTACRQFDQQKLKALYQTLAEQIAACEVGNRPGRIEPRVIKRRRGTYPLIQHPRKVLRDRLRNNTT